MVTQTPMDWLPLLAAINARHRTQLTLGARYGTGEAAACLLHDGEDGCAVLKRDVGAGALSRFRAVATITTRLRRDGYPVPRYRYVGEIAETAYAVLDIPSGVPMVMPSAPMIPQLFALNSLQVGRAGDAPRDWPRPLIAAVLDGAEGTCAVATLRSHSRETAALLARCQAAADAARGVPCITGDIVHGAFTPTHLLLRDGRITAVVDWERACAGDCAFDLVTLLLHTYDVPPLRKAFGLHLRQRLDARIAALYVAYAIVRQVDAVIQKADADAIAHWLMIARALGDDFLSGD